MIALIKPRRKEEICNVKIYIMLIISINLFGIKVEAASLDDID